LDWAPPPKLIDRLEDFGFIEGREPVPAPELQRYVEEHILAPAPIPTTEEQMDQHAAMAAGLLENVADFWPIGVARALFEKRHEGLAGVAKVLPVATNAAAKSLAKHTVRALAADTLRGWFGKKKR
jgi:hypothetical protein